jgi:hypothetical protein
LFRRGLGEHSAKHRRNPVQPNPHASGHAAAILEGSGSELNGPEGSFEVEAVGLDPADRQT